VNELELYQGYLKKVYRHTHGYQQYAQNELAVFAKDKICITYGELLYPSVKKMLNTLSIHESDIFLDLGSGLGKCASQLFIESPFKKIIGIEASPVLHQQALNAYRQINLDFPYLWDDNRVFELICGNFLETTWQGATIVYTCSTCFTPELLIAIGNKINTEPTVKQVMSLRPLPTINLPLKTVFAVECSWDSALCFYYSDER
jgi:hypothetical protein